jgi:CheY-like chemotaxis protein
VHILLVDDHHDTNIVMKVLLERRGYRVTVAGSVRDALEAAGRGHFDLLLSDIGLPDGSGLDIMRTLSATGPIKGIALSGFGMEQDVARSREAGFSDHLTKPVSIQKLSEAIEQLLGS